MRRQYHFWPAASGEGLDAWDVDRLVRLSSGLPVGEVDPSYPIILSVEGRVMDGMHRVARALLEGRRAVPGVRFTEPVEPDYRSCRPEDLPY